MKRFYRKPIAQAILAGLGVVLMSASCITRNKTPAAPTQETSAMVKDESIEDHANQKQALSNGNTVFCILGARKGSMQCHSPEGKLLWEITACGSKK